MRSKVIRHSILTLCASLLFSAVANAAETKEVQSLNGQTTFYDWHYSTYEEPGLMTVKSRIPFSFSLGFRDETSIRNPNENGGKGISWNIEGSYGLVKYDGSGTHNHDYYKLLAEGYYPVSGAFFAGVGYRRLFDNFGPGSTSSSARTYDRLSTYLYAPLGYNVRNDDGSNIKLQYNYFISGQQTSYISQVPGYLSDLVNDQKKGFGFDVSFTNPAGSWEAYYRYWFIEDSEISSGVTVAGIIYGYEPKNRTSEIGLRYRF